MKKLDIEKFKKFSAKTERFTKAVGYISFVCVIVMMLMNVVDVLLGKLFNKPIIGAYELTQRILMCAVFAAFAYGQSKKAHINMTIVIARFPRPVRFVIFSIMSEEKPNQREKYVIKAETLKRYIPDSIFSCY